MSKSHIKAMLITLFDIQDVVHFEFIPQGQTLNQTYYLEILKWLHEVMPRKRPELRSKDWILLDDSAPAHNLLSFKHFLAQKSITLPLNWLGLRHWSTLYFTTLR
jgi:predicted Abi (CAAX) family protease